MDVVIGFRNHTKSKLKIQIHILKQSILLEIPMGIWS
jgi:hypothetical protein